MSENEEIIEGENTPNDNTTLSLDDLRSNYRPTEVAQKIRTAILEGHVDAAKVGVFLKRFAKVAEILKEDKVVNSIITEETQKHLVGNKGTVFGASISYTSTYTAYDFKECGHTELDTLYEIRDEINERIKDLEEELKLLVPKDDYKAGAIPGLGIENTSKSIVFERLPKLIMEDYGVVGQVEPPRKVQKIGLRYNKL